MNADLVEWKHKVRGAEHEYEALRELVKEAKGRNQKVKEDLAPVKPYCKLFYNKILKTCNFNQFAVTWFYMGIMPTVVWNDRTLAWDHEIDLRIFLLNYLKIAPYGVFITRIERSPKSKEEGFRLLVAPSKLSSNFLIACLNNLPEKRLIVNTWKKMLTKISVDEQSEYEKLKDKEQLLNAELKDLKAMEELRKYQTKGDLMFV